MSLKLTGVFAANSAVKQDDVRPVKRVLNRLGYYTPPKDAGAPHIIDRAVFTGLKSFQNDHDLKSTGLIKPGDATEDALNAAIEKQVLSESYIWRTTKDSKVRPTHAEREGQTFT